MSTNPKNHRLWKVDRGPRPRVRALVAARLSGTPTRPIVAMAERAP
jgi:hypothetical protein